MTSAGGVRDQPRFGEQAVPLAAHPVSEPGFALSHAGPLNYGATSGSR